MEATIEILWLVGLGLVLILGLLLALFQLPGTWLILAGSMFYDWQHGWSRLTWYALGAMALLAVAAEAADIFAGMKGAQKAGASRAASWGALIGGFCGLLIFTPLIPIPIVGSVLGGLAGCFAGAFVVERHVHGDAGKSARVGLGAAIGRLVGLLIKLLAAFAMCGIAFGASLAALL